MKQKLIVMAFMLFSGLLKSQSVPMALEDWKTTDGTQNFFFKNAIATDPSGNTIIAGATMSNGFPDILVAKYSSAGAQLWIKQFSGATNGIDFAAGLTVTNTDVYITGAITNNSVTLLTECITMRLASSTGSVVWSSTYIGAAGIADLGKSINVNGSGDVFVTGGSYNSNFNTDFLTIKYNGANGTQLWENTWDYTAGLNDAAYKVNFSGSNVIVGGAVTDGVNTYKYAALTLSQSTGSLLATSIGAGVTTTSVDAVTDVITDNAGYIIIAGSMDVVGQGTNFFVQKLDPANLASVWIYSWNGAGSMNDYVKGISVDASNNVYLSGYTSTSGQGRDIVAIKLNSSGTQQWSKIINGSFNGDDEAGDIAVDASGNSYITGYTTKSTNNSNYYTAKLNSSGTKIWEKETEGNSYNTIATNIELDLMNNIIVTGQSETSPGNYEFLTVKYVQRDVITPTDFNGETPASNFMYYRNKGQLTTIASTITLVPDVKFYTNNTSPSFYFKSNSQSFVFAKTDTIIATNDTLHRIDLGFNNNTAIGTYPMEAQDNGYLNYFLAHTGDKGVTNLKGNKRLITPNLYANIDLMCSSNQNGIKYYFIVKPGGDIRNIELEFTGASSFSLNGTTNALTIKSSIGSLTYDRPTVYQLTAGNATVAVTGWTADWQTNGASNKYKFNHGAYTNSLTLIIEVDQGNAIFSNPVNLQNIKWSTYIGKTYEERVNKLRTDASNNLFAVGETNSTNFPQNPAVNVYNSNLTGATDGFISKFDSNNELKWSTYVGGTKKDRLTDIAFHSNGDLYCVGGTNSADLSTISKSGADNDATYNGPAGSNLPYYPEAESFIFQLSQNGATCPWLRYYGGDDGDELRACAMDSHDNFFIAGSSTSSNIPVIHSGTAYYKDNTVNTSADGIIARFNSSSVITWATYIGSSLPTNYNRDYIYDIVIASASDFPTEDIYITGSSEGSNYPTQSTTGSSNYATTVNNFDAVISRFTNAGDLKWSTYAGGTSNDFGRALAFGGSKIYVTGETYSSDFLSINSGTNYTHSFGGGGDVIYMVVNSLNQIVHSTPVGGSDYDMGTDIAYDRITGTAYISAISVGPNFPLPVSNPANTYSQSYAGSGDNVVFALKDNNTSMLWGTYLGGAGDEGYSGIYNQYFSQSICLDGNSNLYLGGATATSQTQSPPFPLDNGGGNPVYFQPLIGGQYDATITKFNVIPVVAVGINEKSRLGDNAFIYPNPATNMLFVKLNTGIDKIGYKIINTMGQVVGSGNIQSEFSPINIEGLATGVYIIELTNNNSKFTAKFIKRD